MAGTLPNCLKSALENRYGSDGLKCRYRRFTSLEQLKEAGFTLAVVKDSFLTDHCVAVLEVSDNGVILADPVTGTRMLSCQQFESIWRFTGLVVNREGYEQI
jgi:predicted double-glycine peptidase